MRKITGFAVRRPGRPLGSRVIDRNQSDFFPVEKFLAQCGWQECRLASERGSAAPPQAALPPTTNRGGKVQCAETEELKDFCEF